MIDQLHPSTPAEEYLLRSLHATAQIKAMAGGAVSARPEPPYASAEAWLLMHGRFYPAGPRPSAVRQMTSRRCFDNAYRVAARSGGRYQYAEGVAFQYFAGDTDGHVFSHAWCLDREGRVVDPTIDGAAYCGAAFDLDTVTATLQHEEFATMLWGRDLSSVPTPR